MRNGTHIAPPLSRRVMKIREVADYLSIHTSTVYKLLKANKLPGFKVGADWRFNIEDIDKWRLSQTAPKGK